IPVHDMNITLPKHVTIEDFFPTRMTIKLDQIIEKEFKVNVVTTGSPSPGFTLLDSHRINPAVINLKGPEQLLKDKDTVNTVPIDISGLVASKKFTAVHLEPFRSDIDLNNDKFVEVTIRILEKNIDRSFLKIPVQALGTVKTLYKIEISSTEVDITLRGKEEALDAIRPADIKIFFDITDLAIGVYDLPLEGRIPDKYLLQGVTILDIKPATIEATISEKQ
ncbi:hypothetical protein KDK77_08415, partial [bacterium]|nr:hypothetical protein [bacterium]